MSREAQNGVIIAIVAVGLPVLALLWFLQREQKPRLAGGSQTRNCLPFLVLLAAGAVVRFVLAYDLPGHTGDMDYFRDWIVQAYTRSYDHFYDGDFFCDYPPVYIYVLRLLGWIQASLDLDPSGPGTVMLLKTPAIVADLLIGFGFWRAGLCRWGPKSALILSALILLNPAVIMNSAVWGQIDAIVVLLLLGVFWAIQRKRYILSAALFMLDLLLKPQCLFAAPVLLYAFIGHLVDAENKTKAWLELLGSVAVAAALWVLVPWPFVAGRGPWWLVDLYKGAVNQYPMASFNAFNFYALVGLNMQDAAEASFGGISAQQWGFIAVAGICAYSAWLYWRRRQPAYLFVLVGFMWAAVFTLVHSMHERYLYTAPFFLLAGYVLLKDARLLASSVLFFGSLLLNASVVLYYYDLFIEPPPAPIVEWLSLAQTLIFFYTAWVATSIAMHGAREQVPLQTGRSGQTGLRSGEGDADFSAAGVRGGVDAGQGTQKPAFSGISAPLLKKTAGPGARRSFAAGAAVPKAPEKTRRRRPKRSFSACGTFPRTLRRREAGPEPAQLTHSAEDGAELL